MRLQRGSGRLQLAAAVRADIHISVAVQLHCYCQLKILNTKSSDLQKREQAVATRRLQMVEATAAVAAKDEEWANVSVCITLVSIGCTGREHLGCCDRA